MMLGATTRKKHPNKKKVAEELDQLRVKGLAKSQSFKINKTGAKLFRTPEEAQAYLNETSNCRRSSFNPNAVAPKHLSGADLNDWYFRQKKIEEEERRKKKEAENFLRGYRLRAEDGTPTPIIPISSGVKAGGGNASDVVVDGTVTGEVGKLENLENLNKAKSVGPHRKEVRRRGSGESWSTATTVATMTTVATATTIDKPLEHYSGINENIITEPNQNGATPDFSELSNGDRVNNSESESSGKKEEGKNEEVIRSVETDEGDCKHYLLPLSGKCSDESDKDSKVTDSIKIKVDDQSNVGSTNESDEENSALEVHEEVVENPRNECSEEEIQFGHLTKIEEETVENTTKLDEVNEEGEKEHAKVEEDTQEHNTELDEQKEGGNNFEETSSDVKLQSPTNVKVKSEWRDWISNEPGSKFQPEVGRYHLYLSRACPFAHRTAIVLKLKGLQDVIGVTYVHPTWQFTKQGTDGHRGWVFGSQDGEPLSNTNGYGSFPSSWGEEDPHCGCYSIRELYEKAGDEQKKYTVPVLWDTKLNTIVNNNSTEIMRIFNFEFNEFSSSDLNLYPEDIMGDVDRVNEWVYTSLNDGVYSCGLAESQAAYESAIDNVTEAFDKVELILQQQRYIVGETFTEADIRLFVTLLRFDEIYNVYFKANTRTVSSCPTILKYVREIFQMEGVADTCNMAMIKAHYYTSHVELNKYSIIPKGEDFLDLLKNPLVPNK